MSVEVDEMKMTLVCLSSSMFDGDYHVVYFKYLLLIKKDACYSGLGLVSHLSSSHISF